MTPEELIAFEADIAAEYNAGKIRYPVHLSGGNENQLIDIFKNFKKGDWVFSTWRNHWHALLAGIPKEEVKRQIMAGRSMTVSSVEHNFFSSAIVAGCCPIALGVAWALKRQGSENKVWLFLGDMAACTGIAHECRNYAVMHDLPLRIVIEDNGKSVCTYTGVTWGKSQYVMANCDYYHRYVLPWPHAGAGQRIQF